MTKDVVHISDSLYHTALNCLQEICAPYEQLLKWGLPQTKVIAYVKEHLRAVDGAKISGSQKDAARDKLYLFVKNNLSAAADPPPGYEMADWSLRAWHMGWKMAEEAIANKPDVDSVLTEGLLSKVAGLFKSKETSIFYHEPTKSYVGTLNGKSVGAESERQMFKHMTNSGIKPEHVASMLSKFREGNQAGVGDLTATHHLENASRYVELAKHMHDGGNFAGRDFHLQKANGALDKAIAQAEIDLKSKPEDYAAVRDNADHPIHQHLKTMSGMMRGMK